MSAPLVWLLEIRAGAVWRFATERLDLDGKAWAPGLSTDGTMADALSLTLPADRSVELVVEFSAVPGFDAGDVASGASASLYRYDPQHASEGAVLVMTGPLSAVEHGDASEPLSMVLREVPWDDDALLPDAAAEVNDTTMPSYYDDRMGGEYYPIVFGKPGIAADRVAGSPALGTFDSLGISWPMLIAGHPVAATSVALIDRTSVAVSSRAVVEQADGLGRLVSASDVVAWVDYSLNDEVWVAWDESDGGLPGGAGDVIEYLLRRSTLRVDWSRMRAAKARLNALQIAGYIQPDPGKRIAPWTWISDHLLPILPVQVRAGGGGVFIAYFDAGAGPATTVGRLVDGLNAHRISPVSVDGDDDIANDITLRYAVDADTDKTTRYVRVCGDQAAVAADDYATSSAVCAESFRRFGRRAEEITTRVVYDRESAVRLVHAMAARSAMPYREVSYALEDSCPVPEIGDAVEVVDAGLGWAGKTAHVWTVRRGGPEGAEVTLRIYWQGWRSS